jgi:hypothetical protein
MGPPCQASPERILSVAPGEYFVAITSAALVSPELTVTTSAPTPGLAAIVW